MSLTSGILSFTASLLLAPVLAPTALHAQVQIEAVNSKQREAQYALETEQSPLGATASGKRAAALLYVENDHEHHVLLCAPLFQQLLANRHRYANEINSQLLISAAAYLYEHPESANDSPRQTLAGLRAALVAYEKFLAVDPGTSTPILDHLLEQRSAGKLEEALPETCKPTAKP